MKQAFAATALASVMLTAAASAADLPGRYAATDYYAPAPVANWQGFYAGVVTGVNFSSFTDGPFPNATGGLIGVTGGYNYMATPNVLIGLETDFSFSGASSSQAGWGMSASDSVNDILTVRGRLGYAMDRLLIFGTFGLAASNNTATLGAMFPLFWGSQSIYQAGWTVGGGAEFLAMDRVSLKAEYLFTSVGNDTYFNWTPFVTQLGVNSSLVRVGVNYHF